MDEHVVHHNNTIVIIKLEGLFLSREDDNNNIMQHISTTLSKRGCS